MGIECSRCKTKNKIIETEKEFICMKCFWKNYVGVTINLPNEDCVNAKESESQGGKNDKS